MLNTGLYIRDTLNNELINNNDVTMDLLTKRTRSLSETHSHGYVLPYVVYEQQTASARNLWGLQFWANTVGMKVVEPFFNDHRLSFESVVMGMPNPMRFGDLYDVDYWNNQSTKRDCSELVDWEDFLSNAPRTVILVLNRGFKSSSKNAANAGAVKVVNNPDTIVGRRSCGEFRHDDVEFPRNALAYFKRNGFHFAREVCITFNASTPMPIFAFWQGIRDNRVNLKGITGTLSNENTVEVGLLPSKKIVQQSNRYLKRLNRSNKSIGKYFGVMIRIEKVFTNFVINKKIGTFDLFVDYMLKCAKELKQLEVFDMHMKWSRTLAIDLGKFGSVNLKKHGEAAHGIKGLYDAYFSSVFGNDSWTIEEFENSFEKYIGTKNQVYIAQIQRTIAARSDCLVLVGGDSTFQTVAISFYKNFHPNIKEHCIVKHCYYGRNFNFKGFLKNHTAI